jgi:hypothetical protein
VYGSPVALKPQDNVALWHPADDPRQQQAWIDRLGMLQITQPIEQASRIVTLASADAPTLAVVDGQRASRPLLRGFLRSCGWSLDDLELWRERPWNESEATRETHRGLTRHGPWAMLEFEIEADTVTFGALRFEALTGAELDARLLPSRLVSEAARDVLGAAAAASADRVPAAWQRRREQRSRRSS